MSDVETKTTPPDIDEDGDGDQPSARIHCSVIDTVDISHEAAVQYFGPPAEDPAQFAEGLLNVALAVARLRGSDFAWAVMERFTRYDGGASE